MIFHPNPMHQDRHGVWTDTHLQKVLVQFKRVNNSKNPERWVVYTTNPGKDYRTFISQHITEEQAVVSAQTLANRLYKRKLSRKKTAKKIKKAVIDHQKVVENRATMIALFTKSLDDAIAGATSPALEGMRAIRTFIDQSFSL